MIEFPTQVEQIALAGDWHGSVSFALNAVHATPRASVVLHLGDFGYRFRSDYLTELNDFLGERQQILMFIDGNHENFDWLEAQPVAEDGVRRLTERIWHLPRGFRWEWSGRRFLALGGAISIDRPQRVPGNSWWSQEAITDTQATEAVQGGLTDILLTHDCPAGVCIPDLPDEASIGGPELLAAQQHRHKLYRVVASVHPRYLWHGHYHVNYLDRLWTGSRWCRVRGLAHNGTDVLQNLEIVRIDSLDITDSSRYSQSS